MASAGEKRGRSSPTGLTPCQQVKKQSFQVRGAKKQLFPECGTVSQESTAWSDMECSALVEFLLLHRENYKWPMEKTPSLWKSASMHVQQRTKTSRARTGNSIIN